MTRAELVANIKRKRSFLCVGLDPDLHKIPPHLLDFDDPIFEFNKAIIDATHEYAVAYKPNFAFFEAHGVKGFQALQKTQAYLKENYPNQFSIADAKRGDIGNTAAKYAAAIYNELQFDAATIAPYMGKDSVEPFLHFANKFAIVLGLTSNEGAADFQYQPMANGAPLYEMVISKIATWGDPDVLMFVIGATQASEIARIRQLVPNHFFLVPGVGAQGGSLEEVAKAGLTPDIGLLVNSSRGIIYAGNGRDFASKAKEAAAELVSAMRAFV